MFRICLLINCLKPELRAYVVSSGVLDTFKVVKVVVLRGETLIRIGQQKGSYRALSTLYCTRGGSSYNLKTLSTPANT
jgi:hypothetical protein